MTTDTIPYNKLVEKVQSGEYGWPEYIIFNSEEWRNSYATFCIENELRVNNESAKAFADHMEQEFNEAIADGRV